MLPADVLVSAQAFRSWVHTPEAAHFSCPKPAGPGVPQRLSKMPINPCAVGSLNLQRSVSVHLSNRGRKLLEKDGIYIKHV